MKSQDKGGARTAVRTVQTAFEQAALAAHLTPETGKGAVEGKYRANITARVAKFTGSVDLDGAFALREGNANRWDYGLGLLEPGQAEFAVWVEPHSGGSSGEVRTMLAKLDWLEAKLDSPAFAELRALTQQTRILNKRPFHWLSSGRVGIRPGSREAHMLAARGLGLPATHLVL